jgi:hypothetical protein
MDNNSTNLPQSKIPPRKLQTKLQTTVPPTANLPPRYPVRRIAPITPYTTQVDSLNNPMAIHMTISVPAPSAEVQSELRDLGL